LAVSVLPEGLTSVLTLAMLLGVRRMKRYQTVVRRLPAAETLGAVTTVCADKVGIFTGSIWKTEDLWADGLTMSFSGSHLVPDEGQVNTYSPASIPLSPAPPLICDLCLCCRLWDLMVRRC
jgi:magnesium-transporting ATPase (P-type)